MAFGQQSGPPATGRQVRELVDLVVAAGHVDLRDARHALGLTQRQAGGKFTRDEAQTLIDQLIEAEHQGSDDGPGEDGADSDAGRRLGGPGVGAGGRAAEGGRRRPQGRRAGPVSATRAGRRAGRRAPAPGVGGRPALAGGPTARRSR